jgi:serine/threonine protein kinase
MPTAEPTLIAGRYEILRTLGQGAFGRTFLARDRETGREVAIKMLDTQRVDSFKGFELFEREAAVLGSVRHHGVPEIYASLRDEWEGRPAAFLVMEYVAGQSLQALIEERRHLDPAEATHILLELLGVLDYLHGRVPPILHRDIKPANVILRPDGFPTLVDFGAVRSAIHAPGQDGSTIVGTYGYMPYEQHMGQAQPSSDLYALAATFVHLLTGRAPPEFINAEGRIAVPDSLPGGERLREVLSRMLRLSPAERFPNVREVRQALVATTAQGAAPGQSLLASTPRVLPARLELPPAPRTLDGVTRERLRAVLPTTWKYMNSDGDPHEKVDFVDGVLIVFLSLITVGVLPAIFWGKSRARRRKLRHFFQQGIPAVAVITAMQDEKVEFNVKMTRVRYEWEADGQVRRDSDEAFASLSDRWRAGDQVEILYDPARRYDSVIVGG